MMKIISNFKDYYDYLANIYGVDDHVVYVRNIIPVGDHKTTFHFYYGGQDSIIVKQIKNDFIFFPKSSNFRYRYLVVLGKMYLCVQKISSTWEVQSSIWEIFNPKKHAVFNEKPSISSYPWQRNKSKELDYYLGGSSTVLIELSKYLQQPVFFIDHVGLFNNEIHVNRAIPHLKDLHFGSIMQPEQLYQELEYFIGNTLRDNPDTQPPVNVSDKDLIVAKGFDIKKSFRKRKKDE